MRKLIILVGCEESQAITKAFRALGHLAFSCDLKPCSGGHPEWHLQMDVFEAIKGGDLKLQNGFSIYITEWNVGIFHPDCTYLTVSANKWYKDQPERPSGTLVGARRREERERALLFVRDLMNCNIKHIAIENPVCVIGSRIFRYVGKEGPERWEVFPKQLDRGGRKADQVLQPWMFGHGETKATCLWLKNLPKIKPTNIVDGRVQALHLLPPSKNRAELRSKTYTGIANAIAAQWSEYILNN